MLYKGPLQKSPSRILPAGLEETGFVVTIQVLISDSLGANTVKYLEVKVRSLVLIVTCMFLLFTRLIPNSQSFDVLKVWKLARSTERDKYHL